MIFAIVFMITFILGFIFGLSMPFILYKFPYRVTKGTIEEKKPENEAKDIINEWMNGGDK